MINEPGVLKKADPAFLFIVVRFLLLMPVHPERMISVPARTGMLKAQMTDKGKLLRFPLQQPLLIMTGRVKNEDQSDRNGYGRNVPG